MKRRDRQAQSAQPEPPAPGRFSRGAMWAITLLLPFGVLVLLEVGMRLAGAGRLEPLFVPSRVHPATSSRTRR